MYLYFITCGNAIKVGIAIDVKKRITEIQTGNHLQLKLLHSIEMEEDKARSEEKRVLRVFKSIRIRGEWLMADRFLLDFIEHVKKHGLTSGFDFIESPYREYSKHIGCLRSLIKRDVTDKNLIMTNRFNDDIMALIRTLKNGNEPRDINVAHSVRKWADSRVEPFTPKDAFIGLGLPIKCASGSQEARDKVNIYKILKRLEQDGLLASDRKSGRKEYARVTQENT